MFREAFLARTNRTREMRKVRMAPENNFVSLFPLKIIVLKIDHFENVLLKYVLFENGLLENKLVL